MHMERKKSPALTKNDLSDGTLCKGHEVTQVEIKIKVFLLLMFTNDRNIIKGISNLILKHEHKLVHCWWDPKMVKPP